MPENILKRTPRHLAIDATRGFCLLGSLICLVIDPWWTSLPATFFTNTINFLFLHSSDLFFHVADAGLPALIMFIGASNVFSVDRQRRLGKTNAQIGLRMTFRFLSFIGFTYFIGVGAVSFGDNPLYLSEYSIDLAFAILVTGLLSLYLRGASRRFLFILIFLVHSGVSFLHYQFLVQVFTVPSDRAGFLFDLIFRHFVDSPPLVYASTLPFSLRTTVENYMFNTPSADCRDYIGLQKQVFYLLRLPRLLSVCCMGILLGEFFVKNEVPRKRALMLFCVGALMMVVSWQLNSVLPISRRLWSPTFICFACGFAFLVLSGFEYITTVLHKGGVLSFLSLLGRHSFLTWMSYSTLPFIRLRAFVINISPSVLFGEISAACLQLVITYAIVFAYDEYRYKVAVDRSMETSTESSAES